MNGTWTYHTYVVVQNLKAENQPSYVYDLDSSSWARDVDLQYYLGSAYFDIVAGDFNDDGKDTLVAYCPNNSNNIWELSFNGSAINATVLTNVNTLRPKSVDFLTNDAYKSYWEFKSTVSFAVGDFDGDGVDNLAISTGFGNPYMEGEYGSDSSNANGLNKNGTFFERYVTSVSVMERGTSAWSPIKTEFLYNTNKKKAETADSVTYNYDVMHMGAITSGDIDSKQFAYSIISYDGANYLKSNIQNIDINKLEKNHFHHDNNSMWPQIQVAAGHTNGQSSETEIFVDGVIYNGKTGSLIESYTPPVFNQTFDEHAMNDGIRVYRIFAAQVAVGNFDGNAGGREQFVYTLAFQEKGSSGNAARDYSFYLGIVGGCVFDDVVTDGEITEYGGLTEYVCSDIRGSSDNWVDGSNSDASKCIDEKGDNWKDKSIKCLNVVVCAVDSDDDGLLGRFNSHTFITSDPSPIAVIQASPYYEALDDLGAYNDNGGTAYTVGYSFEKTTSKGHSVSFGVGFAGELQIGTFRGSLEAGYALDWSETYEKGFTKEYEFIFTIIKDSVLVSIVPVHVYTYDIWDPALNNGDGTIGGFRNNAYSVSVPAKPVYQTMTIDEYNAAVTAYNAYIDANPPAEGSGRPKANKLNPVTYGTQISNGAVLPDALENPYAYQNWSQINSAQITSPCGETLIGTGTNGGTSESSFTYSTISNHTTEMNHGFTFRLTLQGGGESASGSVEGWGGGYVSLDVSWLSSKTVSTTESEGCVCAVANPNYDNVKNHMTLQELSNYSFNWRLGQWSVGLVQDSTQTTPVIGYVVNSVTSPPSPPKNLDAIFIRNPNDEQNSTVELTWEKPDAVPYGPTAHGYFIYADGQQVNDNMFVPTDPDHIVYSFSGIPYGAEHTFAVKAVTNGIKSPSVEKSLGWVPSAVGIVSITKDDTYVSQDGLTDKYVILFSDDSTFEFYVRNGADDQPGQPGQDGQSGQDGQPGQDGQTAYEAAVANGYTGTYEEWLMVIGAACVEGHTFTTYTQPVSCAQDGVTLSVCSVCGKAQIEVTAKTGHDYGEETFAATCTERGYTVHTCTKCGDQYFTDFVDAAGHSYVPTVVDPTCVSSGCTVYTCSVCGSTFVSDITELAGHDYEAVVTDPTCVNQG